MNATIMSAEQLQFLATAGLIYRAVMADVSAPAVHKIEALTRVGQIARQAMRAGFGQDVVAAAMGIDILTVQTFSEGI